ncbi:di-trans,poly-cis-decaprenylcistransferase [Treponema sp. OMZ 840]|uniref:polyprenyl diphosphate synthase n=1 Tax=Treponema sp. OMZ 840 TaxID=244313 RepID=UPI003D8A825E
MSDASQLIDKAAVPVHIGIIMDGNGRWAQKRNMVRSGGHKEGVNTAREIIKAAAAIGVRYLTLYTFSTENWKRTAEEVSFLMGLLKAHLRAEFEFYKNERVRVLHLGDKKGLPSDVVREIETVENESRDFTGMNLVLAINYGARDEIIRAAQKMIALAEEKSGAEKPGAEKPGAKDTEAVLSAEHIGSFFDIPFLPDADLIIRTGGEKRLSNFLLWHAAYAEFDFTDTLWPDYTKEEFYTSVAAFQKRHRRFGGNTEEET